MVHDLSYLSCSLNLSIILHHRHLFQILETFSYAITLSYAARNAFPFSTYGENLFLTIQNVIITLLIVWYSPPKGGKTRSLTGGGGGKDGNGNWKGLGVGVGVILVSAWILGSETLSPPNVCESDFRDRLFLQTSCWMYKKV